MKKISLDLYKLFDGAMEAEINLSASRNRLHAILENPRFLRISARRSDQRKPSRSAAYMNLVSHL